MLAFAMPAALMPRDVAHIAALANLELDEQETELFARQLAEILAYAELVQLVDTSGVPPTGTIVTRHAADRPDEVAPSLDRDAALGAAPDAAPDAGLFKVPRVIG